MSTTSPFTGIDLDTTGEAWRTDGVCAEVDPDLWFPEQGQNAVWAKRICAGCPVTAECLEAALARDERFGVWGGLTERERDELTGLRRRGRTA